MPFLQGCSKADESAKQLPNTSCDGGIGSCSPQPQKIKIATININHIQFLSDHSVIKDNESDYKDTGSLYPKIQWKPGKRFPISHNSSGSIEIEIEIEIGPPGAIPESGNLVCTIDGKDLLFRQNGIDFSPGTKKIRLKSVPFAKKTLFQKVYSFNWKTEGTSVSISPSDTNHEILFTLDTPSGYAGDAEPGITYKRMLKSINLLQPYGTIDAHSIVKKLMTKLKNYTLKPHPDVPLKFGHPQYFLVKGDKSFPNKEGGAWPMMDYLDYYGECQAIVRFVGNVIKQVGVPGLAEAVYIFANPGSPKVAEENKIGNEYANGYALADLEVKLGKVYPPSHTTLPDGTGSPGFNNFEACLKFTEGGVQKYYGGGMGGAALDTKQEVLKAFFALVKVEAAWYPNKTDPKKVVGLKIVEILATRRDW